MNKKNNVINCIKACPILIGIVVISIIVSIISLCFKDTVYAGYADKYESGEIPLLTLALKGATDGVFPFISEEEPEALLTEEGTPEGQEEPVEQGEEVTEPEEPAQEVAEVEEPQPEDISANSAEEVEEEKVYEFTEVDEDYFCDALFIGDSRTVGLSEYCEPLDERATFYAKVSLTIFDVFKKEYINTDQGKVNLETALSNNQFGKIYIMLGLNEIGTGDSEYFKNAYSEVIDRIRELQPDAIIYIQGIMHVTERKSNGDKNFNNERINTRNEAIAELADNQTIFYIDMNEAVDDENGNLLADLSFDDVHLKASSYQRWYEFLLHNAIVR